MKQKSTNLQSPNSKKTPNHKIQIRNRHSRRRVSPWSFALGFFLGFCAWGLGVSDDPKPLYQNDFSAAKLGELPDNEFLVLDGAFEIKQDGDNKFVELPGAPLDTFSVLFGPSQKSGIRVAANVFGAKQGRRFPTFAVGVNGAGGYRLQVAPAKKQIELYKGDELKGHAPFEWQSEKWTQLRLQVHKTGDHWKVEGKAWLQGDAEPSAWSVSLDEKEEPSAGRASFWGSPISEKPIRFDDLSVAPIQ